MAATSRLLDLPTELRDEVYLHFFMNHKLLVNGGTVQYLQRIPEQIHDEMSAVFEIVWQQRQARVKKVERDPSSGTLCVAVGLGVFRSWHTLTHNPAWARQTPVLLPVTAYCLNLSFCLMNDVADES